VLRSIYILIIILCIYRRCAASGKLQVHNIYIYKVEWKMKNDKHFGNSVDTPVADWDAARVLCGGSEDATCWILRVKNII